MTGNMTRNDRIVAIPSAKNVCWQNEHATDETGSKTSDDLMESPAGFYLQVGNAVGDETN